MKVTESMLRAAIDKAVEAGLLSRHVRNEAHPGEGDLLKLVLQAALDVVPADVRQQGVPALQEQSRGRGD